MLGVSPRLAGAPVSHWGKRIWSTTITRMLGRSEALRAVDRGGLAAARVGFGPDPPASSALSASATPAANRPPATNPPFRKVRRSTLLC